MDDLRLWLPELGLQCRRKHWGPCPSCGATRTRSDTRPPLLAGPNGWRCVVCGDKGKARKLLALVMEGTSDPRGPALGRVLARLRELQCLPKQDRFTNQETPPEPKHLNPFKALSAAIPIRDATDEALIAWCEKRCIKRDKVNAGWLPKFHADWWWSNGMWPVILPACDGRGKIQSIHGIAIGPASRKTTWPRGGYDAGGLLFAGPTTRKWLAGGPAPREAIIMEGGTDFLTAEGEFDDMAVIGIVSGSASALGLIPHAGTRWFMAPDSDAEGEGYAAKISEALYPRPVRKLPLWM